MKRLVIISVSIISFVGLLVVWYWSESNDYFVAEYNDLTTDQEKLFRWSDSDGFDIYETYRKHMFDTSLFFPRHTVVKIKLFKNIPLVSEFTSKKLRIEKNQEFIQFCNDSTNFDWGETTWGKSDAEYCVKLYNSKDKVVGKIYFCIADCGMSFSRPFCPAMKFGQLSKKGKTWIISLINSDSNWE